MKWGNVVTGVMSAVLVSGCLLREKSVTVSPPTVRSHGCYGYRETQTRRGPPMGTLVSWCGEGPHVLKFGEELFPAAQLVKLLDEQQRSLLDGLGHTLLQGEASGERWEAASRTLALAGETALGIHRVARLADAQGRLREADELARDAYCEAARIPTEGLARLPWWDDILTAEQRTLEAAGIPAERLPDERLAAVLAEPGFPTGDARLARSAVAELTRVAQGLAAQPQVTVLVEGHTDPRPVRAPLPYRDNDELGLARARAVEDVLVAAGLPAERVRVASRAATAPPTAGENPRRVVVVLEPCGVNPAR